MAANVYERAIAAIDLRKYDFAIELMGEIISTSPDDDCAFYVISLAYYCKEQYDNAEDTILRALLFCPSDVSYLTHYCRILFAKKEYQKAFEVSDEGLTLNPTDTTMMYWRGHALRKLGKLERAEDVTAYLLKKDPNDEYNHLLYADILSDTKKYDKADSEYKKSLELNPNCSTIYNNYAVMQIDNPNITDKNEAMEMIREALRLEPNNETMQQNLEYVQRCGQWKPWQIYTIYAIVMIMIILGIILTGCSEKVYLYGATMVLVGLIGLVCIFCWFGVTANDEEMQKPATCENILDYYKTTYFNHKLLVKELGLFFTILLYCVYICGAIQLFLEQTTIGWVLFVSASIISQYCIEHAKGSQKQST